MPEPTDREPDSSSHPSDWWPLDDEEHDAQLAHLDRMLARPSRVLDLGAGGGRIARPMAARGHDVVAIERDKRAARELRAHRPQIDVLERDFLAPAAFDSLQGESFDLALCLGHTFLEVVDPHDALDLLARVACVLEKDGALLIDAFCAPLWGEVASGNWQSGLSEDGSLQLVWGEGDNVLALREGEAIDDECWSVRETDRPLRLWSLGELDLLTRAAGWQAPRTLALAHLTVLTPRR